MGVVGFSTLTAAGGGHAAQRPACRLLLAGEWGGGGGGGGVVSALGCFPPQVVQACARGQARLEDR